MDLPAALRSFARDVLAEIRSLADPGLTLEITRDDDRVLAVRHRGRDIVLDRRFGTVKSGGRVLARFRDVQAIELRHVPERKMPEHWTVGLRLGPFSRIALGRSDDDAAASIAAARLSSMTGRPVRAIGW